MIFQTILEGLGLGVLLVLVCAAGIRKDAVGMVHLYSPEVQERCVNMGLTTYEKSVAAHCFLRRYASHVISYMCLSVYMR